MQNTSSALPALHEVLEGNGPVLELPAEALVGAAEPEEGAGVGDTELAEGAGVGGGEGPALLLYDAE